MCEGGRGYLICETWCQFGDSSLGRENTLKPIKSERRPSGPSSPHPILPPFIPALGASGKFGKRKNTPDVSGKFRRRCTLPSHSWRTISPFANRIWTIVPVRADLDCLANPGNSGEVSIITSG